MGLGTERTARLHVKDIRRETELDPSTCTWVKKTDNRKNAKAAEVARRNRSFEP